MFRHRLERVFQYCLLLLLLVDILFLNIWKVSSITKGDKSAADVFRDAFPGVIDPYPDSDLVMLLTGCVLFMAVVADMRFRRLIWICIISYLVYASTVIYFKLPRFQHTVPAGSNPVSSQHSPNEPSAQSRNLAPDAAAAPNSTRTDVNVIESPDTMQTWLLAIQLAAMYLISMFGKVQLELLQRQNFLELELAQKRIDVLEKTIDAIDNKNHPHSHVEETHKRIKDAERIIEKMKLVSASSASPAVMQELNAVLDILRQTEKAMTIMDFQKEVLIGPIKTGVEYKEEEVMNWLERVFVTSGGVRDIDAPTGAQSMPTLIAISSLQAAGIDSDLGVSAKSLMKRLGLEWNLDPFELEQTLKANRATDMNAFCLTARALLSPFLNNVLLGITPDILAGFATAMSNAYLDVPFHNSEHAALVAHHACVLLDVTGLRGHLSGMDRFALILAALGHRVSHFGRTNSYLIDTRHELALRYNDQSVLENFHASKTFEIIRSNKQTNILATLSKKDEKRLRNRVIQLILATDSAHHFTHLSELRMRLIGFTNMFEDPEMTEADKRIGLVSVMMAADMGFYTMRLDTHMTWMERLSQEMVLQGDDEKALGLPISPMCDRETQDVSAMAVGMIKLLVIPMMDEMQIMVRKINPGESESTMEEIRSNIIVNQTHWESKKRGPRPHLESFDMFIPVPKERTIATGSADGPVASSDNDPSSPPSLVSMDSPLSISRNTTGHNYAQIDSIVEEDSEDEGPPILPFSAVHRG